MPRATASASQHTKLGPSKLPSTRTIHMSLVPRPSTTARSNAVKLRTMTVFASPALICLASCYDSLTIHWQCNQPHARSFAWCAPHQRTCTAVQHIQDDGNHKAHRPSIISPANVTRGHRVDIGTLPQQLTLLRNVMLAK
jgi:hypothetical protein